MSDPAMLTGGCLCGAVAYEVPDAFDYALICHCSQCRRATGAAAKPFGGIARAALRVTAGGDRLKLYGDGPDACDMFCGDCGSLL
ncbi:GFA family protein [Pseudooceanicola sp. C21-150M6]|uniref:GFA family protein n=1 Tax=Pseudooceanicola sp. C21-150M6 TaxID=3434355 RepID=UPI003D7FF9DF